LSEASILFELLLMLLLGKVLGDLVKRLGFSPLIGQIIAGVILGPMVLNAVGVTWQLDELSNLGILFMMFLMGLSVDFEKLMQKNVYKASFISICGGLFTFLAAVAVTVLLGFELNTSASWCSTRSAINTATSLRLSWPLAPRTIFLPYWHSPFLTRIYSGAG
jgi:Kef-type K+ transport system membrane component KefB